MFWFGLWPYLTLQGWCTVACVTISQGNVYTVNLWVVLPHQVRETFVLVEHPHGIYFSFLVQSQLVIKLNLISSQNLT